MNTTGKNILIAKFLGYKEHVNEGAIQLYIKDKVVKSIGQLYFHNDWNWLMEVVEKIETLCSNRGFEISSRFVHIRVNNNLTLSSGVCSNKIEAVYKACLTFIEWYNEQK